jgi:hypothetical protein
MKYYLAVVKKNCIFAADIKIKQIKKIKKNEDNFKCIARMG